MFPANIVDAPIRSVVAVLAVVLSGILSRWPASAEWIDPPTYVSIDSVRVLEGDAD